MFLFIEDWPILNKLIIVIRNGKYWQGHWDAAVNTVVTMYYIQVN